MPDTRQTENGMTNEGNGRFHMLSAAVHSDTAVLLVGSLQQKILPVEYWQSQEVQFPCPAERSEEIRNTVQSSPYRPKVKMLF